MPIIHPYFFEIFEVKDIFVAPVSINTLFTLHISTPSHVMPTLSIIGVTLASLFKMKSPLEKVTTS